MKDTYSIVVTKEELYANPTKYAWNCILIDIQFTQEELLHFKEHLDIYRLVKHQQAATVPFLKKYFKKEIDEDDYVIWTDVETYASNRGDECR